MIEDGRTLCDGPCKNILISKNKRVYRTYLEYKGKKWCQDCYPRPSDLTCEVCEQPILIREYNDIMGLSFPKQEGNKFQGWAHGICGRKSNEDLPTMEDFLKILPSSPKSRRRK